ncbi:MAG: YqjK family protein [Aquabacterium sp.]|nr:YqjK family protein [Aquabacterium sp.]
MSRAPHQVDLALKKRMLRQRSAVLRRTLAVQVGERVSPLMGMADRVVASGRWLRQHPAWLVGAGVALLVWRPKGLTRWAGRGLWLWQTWQRLQPTVTQLMAPTPIDQREAP